MVGDGGLLVDAADPYAIAGAVARLQYVPVVAHRDAQIAVGERLDVLG